MWATERMGGRGGVARRDKFGGVARRDKFGGVARRDKFGGVARRDKSFVPAGNQITVIG